MLENIFAITWHWHSSSILFCVISWYCAIESASSIRYC